MADISSSSPQPSKWSNYINAKVKIIQNLTGEPTSTILNRWVGYFDGHDEINKLIEGCKHLDDLDVPLQKLERDIDFDIIWTDRYIESVHKMNEFFWKLRAEVSTVHHLESEKKIRQLESSSPGLFPEYSEKDALKKIIKKPIANEGFNFIAKLIGKKAKLSLKHLRKVFWAYKRLKSSRWLGRFSLKIFWSLLVFTLLIGGVINLFPLIAGVILSVITWFLIEYVGQSRLQKYLDKKYRNDLIFHVSELYMARWETSVALEETNFYLDKVKQDLKKFIEETYGK